jgi:hypothetical protein
MFVCIVPAHEPWNDEAQATQGMSTTEGNLIHEVFARVTKAAKAKSRGQNWHKMEKGTKMRLLAKGDARPQTISNCAVINGARRGT